MMSVSLVIVLGQHSFDAERLCVEASSLILSGRGKDMKLSSRGPCIGLTGGKYIGFHVRCGQNCVQALSRTLICTYKGYHCSRQTDVQVEERN